MSAALCEHVPGHAKGLLAIGAAALLGSAYGVMMRVVKHYGPFGIMSLRGLAQAAAMISVLLVVWRPRLFWERLRGMDRLALLAALGMAGQSFAVSTALLMTTVSNVMFVINTGPAFCVIGDVLLVGESVPLRTKLMVLACLGGVTTVIVGARSEGGSLAGCFVALINPLCWMVYWAIQRRRAQGREVAAAGEMWLVLIVAQLMLSFVSFVVCAGTGELARGVEFSASDEGRGVAADLVFIFFFGACFTPIVQILFSLGPRFIPTSEVACVKITETVWGPLWIYLFDGETPSRLGVVGGSFIVCAVVWHSLLALRAQRAKPSVAAAFAGKSDVEGDFGPGRPVVLDAVALDDIVLDDKDDAQDAAAGGSAAQHFGRGGTAAAGRAAGAASAGGSGAKRGSSSRGCCRLFFVHV